MMQLSDSRRTLYNSPCSFLLPVYRIFNVLYSYLVEAGEVSRDDIRGQVGLVLCDTPCIPRRAQGRDNADYAFLSIGDMSDLVDQLSKVTHLGAHGLVIFSALQFNL